MKLYQKPNAFAQVERTQNDEPKTMRRMRQSENLRSPCGCAVAARPRVVGLTLGWHDLPK
jgi:hypothetical protein